VYVIIVSVSIHIYVKKNDHVYDWCTMVLEKTMNKNKKIIILKWVVLEIVSVYNVYSYIDNSFSCKIKAIIG
jgi:hypothetical protein